MLTTPEIHKAIRTAANTGRWMTTRHAEQRMVQRGFTAPDIERVLRSGVHDSRLDELKNGFWRYRIHGSTRDGVALDLAVIIDDPVIVVTVIGF